MTSLLERWFQIRRDERSLAFAFFAFFVGIGMFYTVGSTVGDTLFLSSLPSSRVPRMLPWVYVGIAFTNVASTFAFDALQARISRTAAIIGTQLVMSATVLLARKLVEGGGEAVYFGLVIWLEACALLSITLFFSFAGDYFTPRVARRLYGFIAGGMAVGTVVSGYAIRLVAGLVDVADLLYVGAGLLLANAATAAWIFRIGTVTSAASEADGKERVALKAIFARPYVRLLSLMIPLGILVTVTVDYQMKWAASTKSEQELAQFFGSFYGTVGAAQILFQFLVVPRLLQRLGIIPCLSILPIGIAAGSFLLYGGAAVDYFGLSLLGMSAAVNFLRLTLSETLDLPSRELLFLPLPPRLRMRVQPLLGGALAPAAQGLAGLIMLGALSLGFGAAALSLIAASAALLLVVVLLNLRPLYRRTLAETLRRHQLDSTDLDHVLGRPEAANVLSELLHSPDALVVKATLNLLRGRSVADLLPRVAELVAAENAEVSVAALQLLSEQKEEDFLKDIEAAFTADDRQVRRAAVLAYAQSRGDGAAERLRELLADDDRALRDAAVVALGRHCGERGRSLARPRLEVRLETDDLGEHLAAIGLIGAIGRRELSDLLADYLQEGHPRERLAACEACASIGDPQLLSPLLDALAVPELRAAAMRALGAMPPEAVGAIAGVLEDPLHPRGQRVALAQVLARIGGSAAVSALYRRLSPQEELSVRLAAAEGLRELRMGPNWPRVLLEGYEGRIEEVCAAIELLDRARRQVVSGDDFVGRIYAEHARLHVELLLSMLALRHDPRNLARIRYNLLVVPDAERGRALELFEVVLSRRLAPRVVPTLQRWLEGGEERESRLDLGVRSQLMDGEPWLRVSTIRHLNAGATTPTVGAEKMSARDKTLYSSLDVVAFLKHVPLFEELPAYYLLEQAEHAEWLRLKHGEILFEQDDRGDALYIICQGAIDVRVLDRTLACLTAGECLGELALLDGQPRSASAVVADDCLLLRVSSQRFRSLIGAQPAAGRAMLRTLDKRIRETQAGLRRGDRGAEPTLLRHSQLMRAHTQGLKQLVSTISFLQQVELFRDLTTAALANLAAITKEIDIYEGDVIFNEGEAGESLYLVCSGRIGVSLEGRQLAVLERNACLGEMALISGRPRSASAHALEAGHLLEIGSEDFHRLLATESEITMALLTTLARRLRNVSHGQREDAA
ncbi:MAG: cyclic nucleotide-binding domain-containing protein [Myxococcales bacterium]|nr:cyclic nucleotide-binding domain-containing protein [Myxococcales bacterium]